MNPQSAASHLRFRKENHFPFPLLVDRRQEVATLYNAGGLLIKRTVYRIGPDGIIRFARRGSPPPDEALGSTAGE